MGVGDAGFARGLPKNVTAILANVGYSCEFLDCRARFCYNAPNQKVSV